MSSRRLKDNINTQLQIDNLQTSGIQLIKVTDETDPKLINYR